MKPHKHAEVLRAIADGKEVEYLSGGDWLPMKTANPIGAHYLDWRVKPGKKPDIVLYASTFLPPSPDRWNEDDSTRVFSNLSVEPVKRCDNLKLTYDGETGELIGAEVVK